MNKSHIIFVFTLCFLLGSVLPARADLSTSGTWAHQHITSDQSIDLTGPVHLSGPIIIEKGATLTLTRHTDYKDDAVLRITLADGFKFEEDHPRCMFYVAEGAKLVIQASNVGNACIGIKASRNKTLPKCCADDGTSRVGTPDWKTEWETMITNIGGTRKSETATRPAYAVATNLLTPNAIPDYGNGGAIYVVGSLEMKCVRVYDCYSSEAAGAIYRPIQNDSKYKFGTVSLTNCRLVQNVSESGAAMIIYNQFRDSSLDNSANTRSSCKTTLTSCTVYQNTTFGDAVGGAIRTGGGVVGDLTMTETIIYYNYSYSQGGGVYWNAHGRGDDAPVLSLVGCSVYNNYAAWDGGGLYLEGACEFKNKVTKIYNNVANCDNSTDEDGNLGNGGGVYVGVYGSGISTTQAVTLTSNFNEYANIYSNQAYDGGGIAFCMTNVTSLASGSTLDMHIDGATITDNTATNDGGGVCFLGDNSTLNLLLTMDSGTISNNTAPGYGGGICCRRLENLNQDNCTVTFNGGTIDSNVSSEASGGGIAVFGLNVNCDEDASGVTVKADTAKVYGGGIYLADGAVFNMNSGTISGNVASNEGGALYITGASESYIRGGSIVDNKSVSNGGGVMLASGALTMSKIGNVKPEISGNNNGANGDTQKNGGGIYIKDGTFTIEDGVISDNSATGYGGGIFLNNDNAVASVNGGEMSANTARYGGGIFVNNGSLNLTGGSIKENEVTVDGGGIFTYDVVTVGGSASITGNKATGSEKEGYGGGVLVANGGVFTMSGNSVISGNSALQNGGGLHARSGAGTISIEDGLISENTAVNGAAISLLGETLTVKGGEISSNVATDLGGGVYAESGDITIVGGEINDNVAENSGGGICFASSGTLTINGGVVSGNTTKQRGGGIYISSGNLSFNDGVLSGNVAVRDGSGSGFGGGLYSVTSGTVSLTGGEILANSAYSGAGVFVDAGSAALSGGEIKSNSASMHGGGIYVGPAELTMTGGDVSQNVAARGGGIYIADTSSDVTFSDGLIILNRALYTSGSFTTATGSTSYQGIGGGIYVGNGSFTFAGTDVGLYNNIADKAADDLFVETTATVTLPNVSDMNMSGYPLKTSELFWVEDYMTSDTGYASGTAVAGADHSAERYRDAIAAQSTVYTVDIPSEGKTFTNTYLALSIGHEIIYITLERSGLLTGESAIYRVLRQDSDGGTPSDYSDDTWTTYSEVLFTGGAGAETAATAAAQTLSRRISLYSGVWKVQEIGWGWSYGTDAAIVRPISGLSTSEEKIFKFTAGKDTAIPDARYGESTVVNDFGAGTSVTL